MRIIAGRYKGRRLVTPKGDLTRPTADQVRTALMDTLAPWLPGARLLDLFAGAGGVGLEALSRGAAHVTFVERDARALAALRDNVAALGVADAARIVRDDVAGAIRTLGGGRERFGLVFLDPPYDTDLTAAALGALGEGGLTTDGALVIAQHRTKRAPAETIGVLRAFRTRRFGETTLTFFRAGAYDATSTPTPEERG